MPIIKSAKKALKVSERKAAENRLVRAKIKQSLKGARIAIAGGDKTANDKVSLAYRELDLAAKKNVIHKNKAARLKSRLAKKLTVIPVKAKPKKAKTSKKPSK